MALHAAVLAHDATVLRSAAQTFMLPPHARPCLSLLELDEELTLSEAMDDALMKLYGRALQWISEASFTIALAHAIDALWEADLDNGPEILAEASHGGVTDICANYPVLFMGQRFDSDAGRIDPALIRLIIVSNNGVDAVEAMLDTFGCPDTGRGLIENIYECLGKFDDLMKAFRAVQNDFNPKIDSAYSDGQYQWRGKSPR